MENNPDEIYIFLFITFIAICLSISVGIALLALLEFLLSKFEEWFLRYKKRKGYD